MGLPAKVQTDLMATRGIDPDKWRDYETIWTDSLWLIDRDEPTSPFQPPYHGHFVAQIPDQLIRRYTQPGDWVLDPFCGSGTTLFVARRLGRNGIGVDLDSDLTCQVMAALLVEPDTGTRSICLTGDSRHFPWQTYLADAGPAHLVLLHPPYGDIIKFGNEQCLSRAGCGDEFLNQFQQVLDNVTPVMADGAYGGLVIGDLYRDGEWIPLGFRCMEVVQQTGWRLRSIVVKNYGETTGKRGQQALWRYRALQGGFYVFRHEYIMVFQRPG